MLYTFLRSSVFINASKLTPILHWCIFLIMKTTQIRVSVPIEESNNDWQLPIPQKLGSFDPFQDEQWRAIISCRLPSKRKISKVRNRVN